MSDQPAKHVELLLLCGKVRDDALTAEDAARLDALLQASDQAKQLYVRYMSVVSLLESRGVGQPAAADNISTDDAMEHDVLAELLALEQAAEAELVEPTKALRLNVPGEQTPWQLGGAARWMIQQPAVWSGVAAVLAIAVVLVFVFRGGNDTPVDPIATLPTPPEQTDPAPQSDARTVATITATHDAVWSGGPASAGLATGDALHPGDRLTLTAGFAEITTNDGAIAILEAPASIELLGHNNALELHSGKLVGICETESSKGFLVRTPHMDITDIGTRFGVDASQATATAVHVYEGVVEVELPDAGTSPAPQRLKAGQAARASAGQSQLGSIELDRSILNRAMMPTNVLAMTGIGLSKGQVDPAWRVVAVDGKPITAGGEMRAHADTTPGGEGDAGPMFLKIDDALLLAYERSGVFTCRSTFEVPASFDPSIYRLMVGVEGDHSVKAVRINGQPMDVPANVTKLISLAFEQALTPGPQQIEIDIQEVNSITQLRSGLRVKLELQRKTTNTEPENP